MNGRAPRLPAEAAAAFDRRAARPGVTPAGRHMVQQSTWTVKARLVATPVLFEVATSTAFGLAPSLLTPTIPKAAFSVAV